MAIFHCYVSSPEGTYFRFSLSISESLSRKWANQHHVHVLNRSFLEQQVELVEPWNLKRTLQRQKHEKVSCLGPFSWDSCGSKFCWRNAVDRYMTSSLQRSCTAETQCGALAIPACKFALLLQIKDLCVAEEATTYCGWKKSCTSW